MISLLLYLLFQSFVQVQTSTSCYLDSLQKPKFVLYNPNGPYNPGKIIEFQCAKGYRFPDKQKQRYTKCVYSRFKKSSEWTIKYFDDCFGYCSSCGDWGECVFDFIQLRFRCKCPDHFNGPKCDEVVCSEPLKIANGYYKSPYAQDAKSKVAVNTEIEYVCSQGYKMVGLHNRIRCMDNGLYYPNPPRCIPENQRNTKCINEFKLRTWSFSETSDMFQRPNFPSGDFFLVGESITLTCPSSNGKLLGKSRLKCLKGGVWDDAWQFCKVPVCKWPVFLRGSVERFKFSHSNMFQPGSLLRFKCDRNYYLFGNKYGKCMDDGEWDEIPSCVTLQVFKNKCILAGMAVDFQGYNKSEPVCVSVDNPAEEAAKNQLKTITVVTSTAAVIFGVLLIIVAGVAFQRRRLLSQIRTLQLMETEERDLTNLDNDIYGQFILPSYDESQNDKPTDLPPSFDEALQDNVELEDIGSDASADSNIPVPHLPPPSYEVIRQPSMTSSEDSDPGVYLDDVVLL